LLGLQWGGQRREKEERERNDEGANVHGHLVRRRIGKGNVGRIWFG
jgi:hypothetical protein